MEHQLTTTGAASAPAAPITAADQARIERYVAKSRSAQHPRAVPLRVARMGVLCGHATLPADSAPVAAISRTAPTKAPALPPSGWLARASSPPTGTPALPIPPATMRASPARSRVSPAMRPDPRPGVDRAEADGPDAMLDAYRIEEVLRPQWPTQALHGELFTLYSIP